MQVKCLEHGLPSSREAPNRCSLLFLLVTLNVWQVLCQQLGTGVWIRPGHCPGRPCGFQLSYRKLPSLLPLVKFQSSCFFPISLSWLLLTSLFFRFKDYTHIHYCIVQTIVKSRKNLGMALNYHPVPSTVPEHNEGEEIFSNQINVNAEGSHNCIRS